MHQTPNVDALAAIAPALFNGTIHQVGFIVEDLQAAKEQWGKLFPGEEWLELHVRAENLTDSTYRGEPGRYAMNLAVIGSGPQIEVIQPVEGPSVYHDWVAEHGYGLHHFGFLAEDVHGTVAKIEAAGLKKVFSGDGARPDGTGSYAYFEVGDQIPILIEVIEPRRPAL